jgi:hypothetical protein
VDGYADLGSSGSSFLASTETDAHGQYTLTGLTPGNDDVEFNDCSGNDYLGQPYSGNPIAITGSGTVSGIDAVMTKGGSISGNLTLTSGGPAVSECVEAFDSASNVRATASTDGTGAYALHSLPPGQYRIGFASPCDFDSSTLGEWYQDATSYAGAKDVTVTQGQDTPGIDDVVSATPGGGSAGNDISAAISVSPDGGPIPLQTTFTATIGARDSSELAYTIDFGDGTTPATGTLDAPYAPIVVDHAYTTKKVFKASVSASDPQGNTASASVDVDANPSLPSRPTSAFASAGDRKATVSWTAPSSDGGEPITGYTVMASPGGQTATVSGSEREADVTGLANGTGYTFTVAATNSVGTGPSSTPSKEVTPQAPTTTTLAAVPDPAVYANDVLLTATVAPGSDAPGAPTGSVEFADGTHSLGSATVQPDGTATLDVTTLAQGDHTLTASYQGDVAWTASTSDPVDEQVVQATTTTDLDATPQAAVYGQDVTLTATVASSTTGVTATPSGTVEFTDGSTELGTAQLDDSGVAKLDVGSLAIGQHTVTAAYDGAQAFMPSMSSSLHMTVSPASTTTQLSAAPLTVKSGQTIDLSAALAVVAPGAGSPTGTVTFSEDGTSIGSSLVTAPSLTTSALSAGDHVFAATYGGDTNFLSSTSTSLTVVVTDNNHDGGGSDPSKFGGGGGSVGGGGGYGGSGGGTTGGGSCYVNCGAGGGGEPVSWTHIHTAGPITDIWISDDLECLFRHTGDAYPSVFTGTTPYGPAPFGLDAKPEASACGTLVSNGSLYGPGLIPDGPTVKHYTPVRQSTVTGTGTSSDPYIVTTVVDVGSNGVRLSETDSYVVGAESVHTKILVSTSSSGAFSLTPTIFRAMDCYLSDWDSGYGAFVDGAPACRDTVAPGDSKGNRLLELSTSSSNSSFVEGKYDDVWNEVGAGGALSDDTDCTYNDNAEAQAWIPTIAPGDSVTLNAATSFGTGASSAGDCHFAQGLSISPTADSGVPGDPQQVVTNLVDSDGNPVVGASIKFAVTDGPNQGVTGTCSPTTCVTNESGQVPWTYHSGAGTGIDTVTAFWDANGNGALDPGEEQATATIDWDTANGFYMALGDSFSSGEGNPPFFSSSPEYQGHSYDSNADGCHRSSKSYPWDAWREDDSGIPQKIQLWACSGATTDALFKGSNGEPNQLDHLTKDTTLVTLTMGGNDAHFAEVLKTCLGQDVVNAYGIPVTCSELWNHSVSQAISKLAMPKPNTKGTLLYDYSEIKKNVSPDARILVLGYPRFFPKGGSGFPWLCNGVHGGDQRWINQKLHDLDVAIQNAALAAGVEYVDTENAFDGHELCNGKGSESAVNQLNFNPLHLVYNFHPNALGHQLLANAVIAELSEPTATQIFDLFPGMTLGSPETVAAGTGQTSFTSTWPGSTVTMSLVSPSGKVIDASSTDPNVIHVSDATSETYTIENPEPGTWKVRLTGTDVSSGGELTTLRATSTAPVHPDPTASFTETPSDSAVTGQAVSFDASASSGDTPLTTYDWYFGDGTSASGAKVTHSYQTPGTYLTQLVVTDSTGQVGVATGAPITVTAASSSGPPPPASGPTSAPTATPTTSSTPTESATPTASPAPSTVPADGVPTLTSGPVIAGHVKVGHSVTCVVSYSGATYVGTAWRLDGQRIPGHVSSSYKIIARDFGHTLQCQAAAHNSLGWSRLSVSSVARVKRGPALREIGQALIVGANVVGQRLTAHPGRWSPTASHLRYQWLRDGQPIRHATGRHYRLRTRDAGARISVVITALHRGYRHGKVVRHVRVP